MKKINHYLYRMDDLNEDQQGLYDLDPSSDPGDNYQDVLAFLDKQYFDVSNAVVQKLVEYAGEQTRKP